MSGGLQIATAAAVFLALTYLGTLAGCALWMALRHGARREQVPDDLETLAVSRFTIPVSLIVVANGRSDTVSETVRNLLSLNYPELEVIVVSDAGERDLQALKGGWGLEAREFFFRQVLETSPIERIYRSTVDARLSMLVKRPTGRADAINCGLNVARYRYIAVVNADMTFGTDALLRAMSEAQRDPATVVGVCSHVEPRVAPEDGIFATFGRLAAMRALLDSRLAWRRFHGALGPDGSVVIWRRDALLGAGGFSTSAAHSDLDMMVRLQTASGPGSDTRIVRNADVFGQTAASALADAMTVTARRQQAALGILRAWLGRSSPLFRDRRVGIYFLLAEFVTPAAQAFAVGAVLAGSVAGWFPWWNTVAVLFILSFGTALLSSVAVLLRGVTPGAPESAETARLLLYSPLEFLIYRPALATARLAGAWSALTSRAPRPGSSPTPQGDRH